METNSSRARRLTPQQQIKSVFSKTKYLKILTFYMDRPLLLYVDSSPKMFIWHRLALAKAAQERGFEVHVAAPEGPGRNGITAAGFQFHNISLDRRSINPLREAGCIAGLTRLFVNLRPDLVHAMRLKPIIYAGIAARMAKVPAIVYGTTGLGYAFSSAEAKAMLLRMLLMTGCRAALRHVNCRMLFENPDDVITLRQRGINVAAAGNVIKGVGLDLSQFPLLPQPEGTPLVVLASRMLWNKGIGDFVHAVELLQSEGVKARFALVGDTDAGNRAAVPSSQLEEWKQQGIVEWWGWREDMVAVFSEAHIVCLPSFYREGVPRVLIEAAASGRPIVTTDAPGCREIVRNGHNGLLVPIRDSRALATALRTLIKDPTMRLRMGVKGRALVAEEFDQKRVNGATLKVYRELLPDLFRTTVMGTREAEFA
jgi:glycosyltransferase involved in cell wall biosynthesis